MLDSPDADEIGGVELDTAAATEPAAVSWSRTLEVQVAVGGQPMLWGMPTVAMTAIWCERWWWGAHGGTDQKGLDAGNPSR